MILGRGISIHALLAESDHFVGLSALAAEEFLSTLSLRRATPLELVRLMGMGNFYPRSPCGERRFFFLRCILCLYISIHALLAESDSAFDVLAVSALLISIHALLAESDWNSRQATVSTWKFLSTLSLRRATNADCNYRSGRRYFYPRSPCGERRVSETLVPRQYQFLSTLSLRRATCV